jgi:large subunit ribosomal protein L24
MAAAKIKKGDTVVVRTGKDKGRTGTVLRFCPRMTRWSWVA